jgi:hypothetical protein
MSKIIEARAETVSILQDLHQNKTTNRTVSMPPLLRFYPVNSKLRLAIYA